MARDYEVTELRPGQVMTGEVLEWAAKHRHFYMTATVNAERLCEYIRKTGGAGSPVPLMAVLLAGLARTVREHPQARTLYYNHPARLVRFEHCTATIPIEREVDGEPIVFLANIKDCDTRTIRDIANEIDRFREASIREIPEFEWWLTMSKLPRSLRKLIYMTIQKFPFIRAIASGVFGVMETWADGVDDFLPITGATVSFAIGSLKERPVAEGGAVAARMTLPLTVMFDQRAIEGTAAARFFESCVKRLDSPDFLD